MRGFIAACTTLALLLGVSVSSTPDEARAATTGSGALTSTSSLIAPARSTVPLICKFVPWVKMCQ